MMLLSKIRCLYYPNMRCYWYKVLAVCTTTSDDAFKTALGKIKTVITNRKDNDPFFTTPSIFLCYAWGVHSYEQFVRKQLTLDLRSAGFEGVILDTEANQRGDISRFSARIESSDFVIVIGTKKLLEKYKLGSIKEDNFTKISLKSQKTEFWRYIKRLRIINEDGDIKPGLDLDNRPPEFWDNSKIPFPKHLKELGQKKELIKDVIQKVEKIEGKFLPVVQKELSIIASRMKTGGYSDKTLWIIKDGNEHNAIPNHLAGQNPKIYFNCGRFRLKQLAAILSSKADYETVLKKLGDGGYINTKGTMAEMATGFADTTLKTQEMIEKEVTGSEELFNIPELKGIKEKAAIESLIKDSVNHRYAHHFFELLKKIAVIEDHDLEKIVEEYCRNEDAIYDQMVPSWNHQNRSHPAPLKNTKKPRPAQRSKSLSDLMNKTDNDVLNDQLLRKYSIEIPERSCKKIPEELSDEIIPFQDNLPAKYDHFLIPKENLSFLNDSIDKIIKTSSQRKIGIMMDAKGDDTPRTEAILSVLDFAHQWKKGDFGKSGNAFFFDCSSNARFETYLRTFASFLDIPSSVQSINYVKDQIKDWLCKRDNAHRLLLIFNNVHDYKMIEQIESYLCPDSAKDNVVFILIQAQRSDEPILKKKYQSITSLPQPTTLTPLAQTFQHHQYNYMEIEMMCRLSEANGGSDKHFNDDPKSFIEICKEIMNAAFPLDQFNIPCWRSKLLYSPLVFEHTAIPLELMNGTDGSINDFVQDMCSYRMINVLNIYRPFSNDLGKAIVFHPLFESQIVEFYTFVNQTTCSKEEIKTRWVAAFGCEIANKFIFDENDSQTFDISDERVKYMEILLEHIEKRKDMVKLRYQLFLSVGLYYFHRMEKMEKAKKYLIEAEALLHQETSIKDSDAYVISSPHARYKLYNAHCLLAINNGDTKASLQRHIRNFEAYIKKIPKQPKHQQLKNRIQCHVKTIYALKFYKEGQFLIAADRLKETIEFCKKQKKDAKTDIGFITKTEADNNFSLGYCYYRLGHYEDALESYTAAKRLYGEFYDLKHRRSCLPNPHVAKVDMGIGNVYKRQMKLEDAQKMFAGVLKTFRRVYDSKNVNVASCMHVHGTVAYLKAKKEKSVDKKNEYLNESNRYYLEALRLYKEDLGPEHVYILNVSRRIGDVYRELSKYYVSDKQYSKQKVYLDLSWKHYQGLVKYQDFSQWEAQDKVIVSQMFCLLIKKSIAQYYSECGDHKEAIKIISQSLQLCDDKSSNGNLSVHKIYFTFVNAQILNKANNNSQALDLLDSIIGSFDVNDQTKLPKIYRDQAIELHKQYKESYDVKKDEQRYKPVSNFEGRVEFIETLKTLMKDQKNWCVNVYGIPGIGKTQTALKFASESYHVYEHRVRLFNAAIDQSSMNSYSGWSKLQEMIDDLINLSDKSYKGLMILDNLENADMLVKLFRYLENKEHHIHVLFISQTMIKLSNILNIPAIELTVFDESEAKAYVKRYIPEINTQVAGRQLSSLNLARFPLLLEKLDQFVCFSNKYEFKDVLTEYITKINDLSKISLENEHLTTHVTATLVDMLLPISRCLSRHSDPIFRLAHELMFAFGFGKSSTIRTRPFYNSFVREKDGTEEDGREESIIKSLEILTELGLIRISFDSVEGMSSNDKKKVFSEMFCHPITQQAIRNIWMTLENKEKILGEIWDGYQKITVPDTYYYESLDFELWEYSAHMALILEYALRLDRFESFVGTNRSDFLIKLCKSSYLNQIPEILKDNMDYISQIQLGSPVDQLNLRLWCGIICYLIPQKQKSEQENRERWLEKSKNLLSEIEKTEMRKCNIQRCHQKEFYRIQSKASLWLGSVFYRFAKIHNKEKKLELAEKNLELAEKFYRKAKYLSKNYLDVKGHDIVYAMSERAMGNIHKEKSKYSKDKWWGHARDCFSRSIERFEAYFRGVKKEQWIKQCLEISLSKSQLGSVLFDSRRIVEAEKYYREALESQRYLLKNEHPFTKKTWDRLEDLEHSMVKNHYEEIIEALHNYLLKKSDRQAISKARFSFRTLWKIKKEGSNREVNELFDIRAMVSVSPYSEFFDHLSVKYSFFQLLIRTFLNDNIAKKYGNEIIDSLKNIQNFGDDSTCRTIYVETLFDMVRLSIYPEMGIPESANLERIKNVSNNFSPSLYKNYVNKQLDIIECIKELRTSNSMNQWETFKTLFEYMNDLKTSHYVEQNGDTLFFFYQMIVKLHSHAIGFCRNDLEKVLIRIRRAFFLDDQQCLRLNPQGRHSTIGQVRDAVVMGEHSFFKLRDIELAIQYFDIALDLYEKERCWSEKNLNETSFQNNLEQFNIFLYGAWAYSMKNRNGNYGDDDSFNQAKTRDYCKYISQNLTFLDRCNNYHQALFSEAKLHESRMLRNDGFYLEALNNLPHDINESLGGSLPPFDNDIRQCLILFEKINIMYEAKKHESENEGLKKVINKPSAEIEHDLRTLILELDAFKEDGMYVMSKVGMIVYIHLNSIRLTQMMGLESQVTDYWSKLLDATPMKFQDKNVFILLPPFQLYYLLNAYQLLEEMSHSDTDINSEKMNQMKECLDELFWEK